MKFFIKNKFCLPLTAFLFVFVVNFAPALIFAADNSISSQLIVCNGVGSMETASSTLSVDQRACGFTDLMRLLQNVIKLLLTKVAFLMFVAGLFYAGWIFLTSGGDAKARTQARTLIWRLFLGYVIALASWVIIKTIIIAFAGEKPSFDTFF